MEILCNTELKSRATSLRAVFAKLQPKTRLIQQSPAGSVENAVPPFAPFVHDLHATMLHLPGVDHTRSTFRFGGRDMRLTDVKGHVIHDIVA